MNNLSRVWIFAKLFHNRLGIKQKKQTSGKGMPELSYTFTLQARIFACFVHYRTPVPRNDIQHILIKYLLNKLV